MQALAAAADVPDLTPQLPVPTATDPGRLLRNGLCVVGYAALEHFFVARTAEIMDRFDVSRVPFEYLPTKLREASVIGAVKSVGFRLSFEPDLTSKLSYVQSHSGYINSTSGTSYRLSPLTFMPSGTNLTDADVEKSLKSVLVEQPWLKLADFASRAGYGGIGLRDSVKQHAARRNEAAHDAEADVSIADLRQLPYDLLALSASFDALFSAAVRAIIDRGIVGDPNGKLPTSSVSPKIVFIEEKSGKFAEVTEGARRATKIYERISDALSSTIPRASKSDSVVVVRDSRGRPVDWRITTI
jgi:hypothetical protein